MKKVCILSTVDLTRLTILSVYTDYLDSISVPYDLICVKKFNEEIKTNAAKTYEYDVRKCAGYNIVKKMLYYWKMRKFAADILKNNNYDLIITWNEFTAFIFSDILSKHFKGKYCINIRDYQHYNNPLVFSRLKNAVTNSAFNTVSSPAFCQYLPKADYLMVHSLNTGMLKPLDKHQKKQNGKINILNVGQIRWLENIYPLLDELGNDERFNLIFAGSGSDKIKEYTDEKGIKNVEIYGRFKPEETAGFLKNADIIFNLYGVGNKHVDTALSIKFYYAVYLGIPILTYENTYINKTAVEAGIAYTVKSGCFEDIGNKLYTWYVAQDFNTIRAKCDEFIKKVDESQNNLYRKIDNYVL